METDLETGATSATVEKTYKAPELEGWIDIYFYRKVGFQLARLFATLGMTPTAVSVIGCISGVIAGHFYYYRDLRLNIFGMLLHIAANAFDNADGQLARLTNQTSRMGRLIDGMADHLVWLSIYFHLALRCVTEGSPLAIAVLALAAGLSHGCQAAAADYYRSGYLYFVRGRARSGLDSSLDLRTEFQRLRWRDQPWQKILLAFYLNFTLQQERLAPGLQRLHQVIEHAFSEEIPLWLRDGYRQLARPFLVWWRLLMTNTRMLLLFLLLLIGRPIWYFWVEVSLFNFPLVYLLWQQENALRSLVQLVTTRRSEV
ncbi:MAG TPA: CDP-alcohol phosphatidyltransferase family protein [Chthoniobacterales bacterium]|nr:CDP-alcohol phosphatidyltransferase family protein [Chthoniobacterales bacterium]